MATTTDDSPQISDPDFREAVQLMDAGDVAALERLLREHPRLLTDTADEAGSFAGDYFAHPRLLWFVAENPIRRGTIPDNVTEVIRLLAFLSQEFEVPDLTEQLNYTLALVTSGAIARQTGQQANMVRALVSAGADAQSGLLSGLAHGQRDACEVLLECRTIAPTLPVAAGMGHADQLLVLLPTAAPEEKHAGLALAAINGQADCVRILLDHGVDSNAFNPEGMHAHSTALHQAVNAGCPSTVCVLLTRGADMRLCDKLFGGDARGWAEHMNRPEILRLLDDAEIMLPAISAIRTGDVGALQQWLQQHPSWVNRTLGDDPRTLLHYATDWPGGVPAVPQTVSLLVAAGADVDATVSSDATMRETPLHWAASTDDVDAARALLSAGANIDATGGCIGNGTPLVLAVIYQNLRVADLLLQSDASFALPLVAGLGRQDLVERFFDASGQFRNPYPSMPHYDSVQYAQRELDGGLCLAAMAGHLTTAVFLVQRGANVNMYSFVQTTPLDEAANNGHVELAEYLITQGAKTFDELDVGNCDTDG